MSGTTINSNSLNPTALFKLAPGQAELAMKNAKDNAADQVFIQHGGDTFVALGSKMSLGHVKPKLSILFTDDKGHKQTGTVIQKYNHLNSFSDGFKCKSSLVTAGVIGSLFAGVAGITTGASALGEAVFVGTIGAKTATWGRIIGSGVGAGLLAAVVAGGTVMAVAGLIGTFRPTNSAMTTMKTLYGAKSN